MKILFISLLDINSIKDHGLYSDLLREFVKNGHELTVISPVERRTGKSSEVILEDGTKIIKVKIGNIQKTNYIEKSISTLLLDSQLTQAIKSNCDNLEFDILLYATPPITICKLIKKLKIKTGAQTFLMLKDIWPQEMVDLNLIKKGGLVHRYFMHLEKLLYDTSDKIGYTSPANRKYLVNLGIANDKLVAVNNSVDPRYRTISEKKENEICKKYEIDEKRTIFFYGGNLGKPQDIDHLIRCLETQLNLNDRYYIICGHGTDYKKIEDFFSQRSPNNMRLFPYLPKEEYDDLVMASDVGLVFLNHKFTVPNCPSRFYTYMEYGKSVFACTDKATDIKDDIINGNFGWWCESVDPTEFSNIADKICNLDKVELKRKGELARDYLEEFYTVDKDYLRIISSVNN